MPGGAYLLGIAGNAVANTAIQIVLITLAGKLFFGVDWPQRRRSSSWCSSTLGVVCFASLGVAFSHVIPNFDSAPAYVNAVFLPVDLHLRRLLRRGQRAALPARGSRRRCRSST